MTALAVLAACGGESESTNQNSDASVGGATSGGAGGSTSGGNGGAGGSVPDSGASGSAGAGGCTPTQIACPGCEPGSEPAPDCIDGTWVCPDVTCADAAVSCTDGLVPTSHGCLACAEILDHIDTVIESALSSSTACNAPTDCVFGATSTTCAGACPVAVSKDKQADFEATVTQLSAEYCQDFVPTCGYSTPKCASTSPSCVNGACTLVPN